MLLSVNQAVHQSEHAVVDLSQNVPGNAIYQPEMFIMPATFTWKKLYDLLEHGH